MSSLIGCFQTSRVTFFTVRRWSQEQCQKEGMGNDEACLDLFSTIVTGTGSSATAAQRVRAAGARTNGACPGKLRHWL